MGLNTNKMTLPVKSVVMAAELIANDLKTTVTTTHLLIAMCECERRIPEVVLMELGVSAATLSEIAQNQSVEDLAALDREIFAVATMLGHRYPGLEHLFLAICRDRHLNGAKALLALGVDLYRAQKLVFGILGDTVVECG